MNNILISILTPTYKRRHLLEETIKSFTLQFNPIVEMVIVNDHKEVKYRYDDHPNIHILNTDTRFSSVGKKCEWGYNRCKGDFIYRLDDDDLIAPNGISKIIQDIGNNPGYDIYRGSEVYYFNNNKYEGRASCNNNGNIFSRKFLDRVGYADRSYDDDRVMVFEKGARVFESNLGPYMCYRWGMNTFHVSGSGERSNREINESADMYLENETGEIYINPGFQNDYYSLIID